MVQVAANQAPTIDSRIPNLIVTPETTDRPFYADLRQVFGDLEDSDSQLVFEVVGNTNATLVVPTIDDEDMLHLNLADNPSGATTISVQARDSSGATVVTSFTVDVISSTTRVSSISVSGSSLTFSFNTAIDQSVLNLFDGVDAISDVTDVTLIGTNTGPVHGSLIFDAAGTTSTFIKTGGPLVADNYTLTLFSRMDGWKDIAGNLLDGDGDSVAGGNLVYNFTVASSTARVVSIADFARGATTTAGQTVNVSYNNGLGGIPVTISDAADVLAIDFDVVYNHTLLDISSAFVNVLPAGWSTTVNVQSAGRVKLSLSGSTPLSTGSREIARILASVPTSAAYGAAQILRIENLHVYTQAGGASPVPSLADAGLHKAIFVGDTNADGQYTAQDAGWISGIVVQATSGFDAYPLIDPVIIADVTQNGMLDGLDAAWVSRKNLAASLQPEIPDLPAGSLNPAAGIDPTISIDLRVPAPRGSNVDVPLRIIDSATGLWGVDANIAYETGKLNLISGLNKSDILLAGMFATEAGWAIDSYTDDAVGTTRLSIYRATASTSTQGQIASVRFHVDSQAALGESPLTLSGYTNVPPFTFSHVSGSVLIQPALPLPKLVGNVVIGDGTSQRSTVDKITMTFDGPVDLDAGAFSLIKRGGSAIAIQAATAVNGQGQMVVTLTFSGTGTRGNSALLDGYYQLTIDGTKITRNGRQLDINDDGVGGDTKVIGAVEADNFFALFGDTSGDGLVGIAEFGQFRAAFGKLSSQPGYNQMFDYERDGAVGISDFGQFRARFGKPKPPF